MHRGGTTRGIGESAHNRCLIEQAGHGVTRYNKYGCRCDECRDAHRVRIAEWTRKHNYWSKPDVAARRKARRSTPEARSADKQRWSRYYRENREQLIVAAKAKEVRRKGAPTIPFTVAQLEERLSMFAGCWMCGAELDGGMHIDHVKPLSKGGWHCLANLRPACGPCNLSKGAKWPLSELETLRASSQG